MESRPVFEGGRQEVPETEFTREFWRDEIEVEKLKTVQAIESATE